MSTDDRAPDASLPAAWSGLLDDAAIFPPGNASLPDAVEAYAARSTKWYADLVASLVCKDTDIGSVASLVEEVAQQARRPEEALQRRLEGSRNQMPLSIVITGGAGAIAGALKLADRRNHRVAGLEIALRDLDDLAGNARRVVAAVDAARTEGVLDDATQVFVELPQTDPGAGWLGAADEVAAAELRLKFRTGGVEAHLFPSAAQVASWIDAALDRETPFKCTAGLHNAVRHRVTDGFERPVDQHGFLNVLLATRALFDGASTDDAVVLLESADGTDLADLAREADLVGARRWFTSFGSCSVREPLDDLLALGLLKEKP